MFIGNILLLVILGVGYDLVFIMILGEIVFMRVLNLFFYYR